MSSAESVVVEWVAPMIGVLIGNVMWASPLPDILEARKTGDIQQLNPLPWACSFSNCLAWTYYAKVIRPANYFIFFGNIFGVGLSLFYILSAHRLLGMRAMKHVLEAKAAAGTDAWAQALCTADPNGYASKIDFITIFTGIGMVCLYFFFDLYGEPKARQLAVGNHFSHPNLNPYPNPDPNPYSNPALFRHPCNSLRYGILCFPLLHYEAGVLALTLTLVLALT